MEYTITQSIFAQDGRETVAGPLKSDDAAISIFYRLGSQSTSQEYNNAYVRCHLLNL